MTTAQMTPVHLSNDRLQSQLQDRFGYKVAARLSSGNADLPHDISERLRVARQQAVQLRKRAVVAQAVAVQGSDGVATLSFGDEGISLWSRFAALLPLIVFIIGLLTISTLQTDQRAAETAEVDAAMLTDSLPPSAYADPGFVQFLKIKTGGTNATGINDKGTNESGAYTEI